METTLAVVLCIIVAIVGLTIVNLFGKESPTLKEITERKYSFDELLDLIKRAQIEEGREIKNKLYTHKEVLEIVDKAMDRIILKEKKQEKFTKNCRTCGEEILDRPCDYCGYICIRISEGGVFKPKTQSEFIYITNKLEKQGILNEDYDNYYSPGCTITVQGNRYYTN